MAGFLLLDSHPIVVIPELASIVGLNEAIVLQQVHYWIKTNQKARRNLRNGFYWVYNTYRDWAKQFPWWSEKTIKRTITRLENKGLLISDNFNKMPMDQTKWYRIDYDVLNKLIPLGQNVPLDEVIMAKPIPEITTENNNGTMEEWNGFNETTKQNSIQPPPIVDHCNYEISEFVDWYFELYSMVYDEPHPHLKSEQKVRVCNYLEEFCNTNGLDADALRDMAYAFFDNVKDSDHNINHFATAKILENRYYEVLY